MKSDSPIRIVIVGGVAGGMSAAVRARRLDESASIVVLEQGSFVSYANCGVPYALGEVIQSDSALVLNTETRLESRFNLDIRLRSECLNIDRENRKITVRDLEADTAYQLPYNKLILSQGAQSFRPTIAGINEPHIFTLQTIPDLAAIKQFITQYECRTAAVIGGGFIGLEAAENLRRLGLEVCIIEVGQQVFGPFDGDMAELLHSELRRNNVRLELGAKILRIKAQEKDSPGRIILQDRSDVSADVVIVAVGVHARMSIAKAAGLAVGRAGVSVNAFMQTSDPDIYAVGDLVETEDIIMHQSRQLALGGPANRQGRLAVDHILGVPTPYRGNVGTFVCKIFDLTAAVTGLSIKALRAAGYSPIWVTVHPPDHAGYYPGSQPMTLRVAFEPVTGYLLGAQIVGKKGVDKRIDILSTALQARMSIFDLEHLELAYAPPYGAAKDPVNMAGFVGADVLRRQVKIVHPDELSCLLSSWQMIDVRSPDEFEQGHLPNAVNIPIDKLRSNLSLINKTQSVLVYCWVGYRGYLAYRILTQLGYNVSNLDGGFKMALEGGHVALLHGHAIHDSL